jgi:hypothetical protein
MFILDPLPIWAVYLLTVGLVLLAAEIGFRAGVRLHRHDPSAEKGTTTGAVVGGMLGLLAFLLAFSIGLSLSQFNTRRQLVVTEANAIGTSYLRADFLGEPDRAAARNLLREYVDVRLAALDPAELEEAIRRSEEIHNQLWSIVRRQGGENSESVMVGLFVDAVNEVIDIHSLRLVEGLSLRIPGLMWLVFYGTAVLSFFVLGLVGSADGKRNPIAVVLFALALAAVLVLIVDLDRSQEGVVNVGQKAMLDLQRQIGQPVP